MTRVLVIGVRGQTGREIAALLRDRDDVQVRGTARDAGTIDLPGVEPARFDWFEPDTWGPAVGDGVDATYVVRPEIAEAPDVIGRFLAEHGAKAGRVVLLSEADAGNRPDGDWARSVEQAVTDNAAQWTILRPSSFHQMFVDERALLGPVRDEGKIELPTGGGAIAFVDARDIAAVAVEALLDPAHVGKAYALTGPEALTFTQTAEKLTAAAGHPVEYVDGELEPTLAGWAEAGVDAFTVSFYRAALTSVRGGGYGRMSDDVERVTGSAPRPLDAFVEEQAATWRR